MRGPTERRIAHQKRWDEMTGNDTASDPSFYAIPDSDPTGAEEVALAAVEQIANHGMPYLVAESMAAGYGNEALGNFYDGITWVFGGREFVE